MSNNLKAEIFALREWYSCRGLAVVANSAVSTLGFNTPVFYPILLSFHCPLCELYSHMAKYVGFTTFIKESLPENPMDIQTVSTNWGQ